MYQRLQFEFAPATRHCLGHIYGSSHAYHSPPGNSGGTLPRAAPSATLGSLYRHFRVPKLSALLRPVGSRRGSPRAGQSHTVSHGNKPSSIQCTTANCDAQSTVKRLTRYHHSMCNALTKTVLALRLLRNWSSQLSLRQLQVRLHRGCRFEPVRDDNEGDMLGQRSQDTDDMPLALGIYSS